MTDDELEQLLGRQRLAAPRSTLRSRVLHSATGDPVRVRLGVFDYAMAALAIGLLLAVTLIDASAARPSAQAIRQREISDMAEALGGGPDAMRYAAFVVSRQDEPVDPASLEGSW